MNIYNLSKDAVKDINLVSKYLAARDINELDRKNLEEKYRIEKADLLILLGNSVIYTAEKAFQTFKEGIAKKIMIVGGIGHSTEILRNNIRKSLKYSNILVENRTEAEILKDIAIKYFNIDEEVIILESESTNCGDNAIKALELLKKYFIKANSIILMQDPTMQLRSWASFKRYSSEGKSLFINYAALMPELIYKDNNVTFSVDRIEGLWDLNRFLSLITGEIPRLIDNEYGYGPKGKNFIIHIDIPKEVMNAYERIKPYLVEISKERKV